MGLGAPGSLVGSVLPTAKEPEMHQLKWRSLLAKTLRVFKSLGPEATLRRKIRNEMHRRVG